MITINKRALEQVYKLIKDSSLKKEEVYLRVGVTGSGCAGLSYKMDFDDKLLSTDELYEDSGLRIICDKKSILYLWGTELRYSDGLNGKGFEWANPNSSRTCGCGSSFSV